MNEEILHNLLTDLAISYRIIANDKDKIRLSKYHQTLNDFLIDYEILQSKIDKANEILEEILVVNDWEHEGRFRPVKNTTAQDVYKAVCMLYGILETPYRSDYGALKEEK